MNASYAEVVAWLYDDALDCDDCDMPLEAARKREAAALLADAAAALPDCPTCGGSGFVEVVSTRVNLAFGPCPDCDHGKVTVAQLVATWQAVHGGTLYDHMVTENQADRFITGWFAAYDHLRSVRPPSTKEGT